jgi:membrane protein implicated in regulation of membrane protease activity
MMWFIATLIGLALLWHIRHTDFAKAMIVMLGVVAFAIAVILAISFLPKEAMAVVFIPGVVLLAFWIAAFREMRENALARKRRPH